MKNCIFILYSLAILLQVGVYMPKPFFAHGQLYVACSRVTDPEGLKILIESPNDKENSPTGITNNIVYNEIFQETGPKETTPVHLQLPRVAQI